MLKLLRLLLSLALLGGFVWFGATVPLGNHTLFGHVGRIWRADETQDLVEGARDTARPAVEKVRRGVEKGIEEIRRAP